MGGNEYYDVLSVHFTDADYNGYSAPYVFYRAYIAMELNPNIAYVNFNYYPGSTQPPVTEPDYTFERLLTMNKEEICGISEECAYLYDYVEFYADNEILPIFVIAVYDPSPYLISDGTNCTYADSEAVLTDFSIPREILRNPWDPDPVEWMGTTIDIDGELYEKFFMHPGKTDYKGYSAADVYTKAYIALVLHPNVKQVYLDIPAAPPEPPTDASPTEAAATSSPETAPPAQTSASPQTTAPASGQSGTSSPRTGDTGTAPALCLAALSLIGCTLMQKKKNR